MKSMSLYWTLALTFTLVNEYNFMFPAEEGKIKLGILLDVESIFSPITLNFINRTSIIKYLSL